jgi:hypothetical protein
MDFETLDRSVGLRKETKNGFDDISWDDPNVGLSLFP